MNTIIDEIEIRLIIVSKTKSSFELVANFTWEPYRGDCRVNQGEDPPDKALRVPVNVFEAVIFCSATVKLFESSLSKLKVILLGVKREAS